MVILTSIIYVCSRGLLLLAICFPHVSKHHESLERFKETIKHIEFKRFTQICKNLYAIQ